MKELNRVLEELNETLEKNRKLREEIAEGERRLAAERYVREIDRGREQVDRIERMREVANIA